MAIWQYTFHVLHKESVNTASDFCTFNRDDEGFDDSFFWKKHPLKKVFFNEINLIFNKSRSWSLRIDLYGNQESNCFEVLHDNEDNVLSVSFRIDYTSNYEPALSQIIEFCVFNGLIILDENLNIVPLNFENAKTVIEHSPQIEKYNKLSK